MVNLEPNGHYEFASDIDSVRVSVSWVAKSGTICDMDLHAYIFDERVSVTDDAIDRLF